MEKPPPKLPTQNQLLLPLLETLQENGGSMTAKNTQITLAQKLGVDEETQHHREFVSGAGEINLLGRRIRWTRQTAVQKGLIKATSPRNIWNFQKPGKKDYRMPAQESSSLSMKQPMAPPSGLKPRPLSQPSKKNPSNLSSPLRPTH